MGQTSYYHKLNVSFNFMPEKEITKPMAHKNITQFIFISIDKMNNTKPGKESNLFFVRNQEKSLNNESWQKSFVITMRD